MLYAHAVPAPGPKRDGDTEFADPRAAWDALSSAMKERIEPLVAEHSIFHSRAQIGFTDFTDEERATMPPAPQRLVRVHPGSGRKTLYLASHASHIIGWPVPDGMLLLRERGILKGESKYYVSLAHPPEDVRFTIAAWESAIKALKA